MSDSRHSQQGERVGPYRVEGLLGMGGMGEVVVAYDERLDRRVAIKRIRHDGSRDLAAARERLRREARSAAGLDHPSIVRIHDILADEDGDAIVMELVEGRSVAQCLEQGPFTLPEALQLGRQVAEGLAEAHRAGLVHRDLKSENVMVVPARGDHPARAKILDFGLVKRVQPAAVYPASDDPASVHPAADPPSSSNETLSMSDGESSLTCKGAVVGTARAMSPEQAVGAVLDQRSDLFSFGVLLYEMLTGRSPFRGPTPAETVRRLVVDTPRPLRALRRDAPEELEQLIESLLEKEPDRRPRDADQVARTLKAIAELPPATGGLDVSTIEGSFSDLPTGSYEATPPTGRADGPVVDQPTPAMDGGWRRWRIGAIPVAVAVAIAVVVVVVMVWRSTLTAPVEALRVVVQRPEIVGQGTTEIDFVASGVHMAALSLLATLDGIAPVETSLGDGTSREPRATAWAEAADEVLAVRVEGQAGNARISARRIRVDGEVLWAATFDVPSLPGEAGVVAEAVAVQLQRAYPDRGVRVGFTKRDVRDEDYVDFLQTLQRIQSGEVPWGPELVRLEAISARAPHFMAAHLKGVGTAWTLHTDTRDTSFLDRAETMLTRARALAPEDPLPWYWTFRLALGRGERDAAEQALAKLIEVAPNSRSIGRCHASLAEHDGDLGAAVAAMRSVVERVPSWQNLLRLADLEQRRGNIVDARVHLEQLVDRLPANTWPLGKLARLELFYGDLARAIVLYQQAIALKPHRSYFTNLGLANFLLGRFDDAVDGYRQALAVQPGNLTARFNLADAEKAQGATASAQARYRQIAEELESRDLAATERMTLAQCLAQLGEAQQAVAVTLETLQDHPEDLEVVYQAALVYALVGDVASALVNAEKALVRGYPPRWFGIPDFAPLRTDPRFVTLIDDH